LQTHIASLNPPVNELSTPHQGSSADASANPETLPETEETGGGDPKLPSSRLDLAIRSSPLR
jgi:hypothetical protein